MAETTLIDVPNMDERIQYTDVESGIRAHAEIYSFNIESELFHQLTKEQQALWRKEIEQAVISGGYCGVELARDKRYKENQDQIVEKRLIDKAYDYIINYCPLDYDVEGFADDFKKYMEEHD